MQGKQKPAAYEPKDISKRSTRQPSGIPNVHDLNLKRSAERGSKAATRFSKVDNKSMAPHDRRSPAWGKRVTRDPKMTSRKSD